MPPSRTHEHLFARWWRTVDRPSVIAFLILMLVGAVASAAGSPPVAEKLKLGSYHFVYRQLLFLAVGGVMMFVLSLLPPPVIRKGVLVGFGIVFVLLLATFATGSDAKGAKRWLYLGGMSVQPSEFLKPFFIVLTAWLFAGFRDFSTRQRYGASFALYVLIIALLILQPDFGMVVVFSIIWWGQFILAGLPLYILPILLVVGVGGVFTAYTFLPHVAHRIDTFLNPDGKGNYQVERSLEAFDHGGVLGTGPGEGTVKYHLPDSHTDFVFAVIGEEFGLFACLFIIGVFAFIVIRGLWRLREESDVFTILAVAGLLFEFGVQAFINMGVTLHLLPTKGMTLPFLSYGGSSVLAISIGMGMYLALTRRRYGYRGG